MTGLWGLGLAVLFLTGINGRGACAETPSDTLVVGWEAAPKSGDPRFVGGDANAQYAEELRFVPLLGSDEEGGIRYLAAESVTTQGDGTNWTVKLRKGLRFANGKEMTSDDVVATYQRVLSETVNPPSPRRGNFAAVDKVEVASRYEVVFRLQRPVGNFLSTLVVGILPKEAASAAPEDVNGKGYESGPYVAKVTSDTEWVLERNEKYAGNLPGIGKAKMKKVVFKVITDDGARYSALLKGDLDLVQNSMSPEHVIELQKNHNRKFNLTTLPQTNTTALAFNMKDSVFKKKEIREAIAKAIDCDEILKFVIQGLGVPAVGMFPRGYFYFDSTLNPAVYDPKESMAILDAAGFKDPDGSGPVPRIRFTLKVDSSIARIAIAKAIAGQLKRVGLRMDIEVLERETFLDQLMNGNVAVWIQSWTGLKDPDILDSVFHSKKMPPVGSNFGFYSNPEVDKECDAGIRALDSNERREHYRKVQRIVDIEKPYVWLWHGLGFVATSKAVTGFKLYADGRYAGIVNVEKM